MPLRHEPDVANANWFTQSGEPWAQLSSIGPSGFARYARVFHPVQPGADESDRDSLINLEGHLDHETLQRLVGVLEPHTTTPLDCFFGLWDGFGDIHGSPSVGLLKADSHGLETDSWIPPAFSPVVLNGPPSPRRSAEDVRTLLFFPYGQAGAVTRVLRVTRAAAAAKRSSEPFQLRLDGIDVL